MSYDLLVITHYLYYSKYKGHQPNTKKSYQKEILMNEPLKKLFLYINLYLVLSEFTFNLTNKNKQLCNDCTFACLTTYMLFVNIILHGMSGI